MSGSAALAAARRRRASGLNPPNSLEETPNVTPQKPVTVNPMVVLKNHDLILKEIINDIEQLKRNNPNIDDSQQDSEFNNRLTKVQEFCLETNLEMMKIKKQVDTLIEFMNTSNKTNVVIHEEECSNLSEND